MGRLREKVEARVRGVTPPPPVRVPMVESPQGVISAPPSPHSGSRNAELAPTSQPPATVHSGPRDVPAPLSQPPPTTYSRGVTSPVQPASVVSSVSQSAPQPSGVPVFTPGIQEVSRTSLGVTQVNPVPPPSAVALSSGTALGLGPAPLTRESARERVVPQPVTSERSGTSLGIVPPPAAPAPSAARAPTSDRPNARRVLAGLPAPAARAAPASLASNLHFTSETNTFTFSSLTYRFEIPSANVVVVNTSRRDDRAAFIIVRNSINSDPLILSIGGSGSFVIDDQKECVITLVSIGVDNYPTITVEIKETSEIVKKSKVGASTENAPNPNALASFAVGASGSIVAAIGVFTGYVNSPFTIVLSLSVSVLTAICGGIQTLRGDKNEK